jgi:uncharacterized membrane protein YphA (DoxX/SURF4 family)
MNETMIENKDWSLKMKDFAPIVLRMGLSLVFLWFAFQQIINTDMWTSMIPDWIVSMTGQSAATLVHFNAAFEVVFGACLMAGYFTRVTALLLALHMLDITFTVGYTSIGVRDFGLSIATIAVFLYGTDLWCIDNFWRKK